MADKEKIIAYIDKLLEKYPKNYYLLMVAEFIDNLKEKEAVKKERIEECPFRQVGCTMYDGHILECKGACSWVVDYPKLKELKLRTNK